DLRASGRLPSSRLETIFRQAAESQIVVNAHRIRRGEPPELAHHSRLGEVDCVFVSAPGARAPDVAAEWAVRHLPRLAGVDPGEVQVLAPLTRVCQALNASLQATLNPPRGQPERPHGALALRVGDRVIQTRNNYGLGVFNGDAGLVEAAEADRVVVDFGDGRRVEYAPADLLDLDHAYCLTVHRAQGSEWPAVVLIASSSHGPILSRNLLYTALTRARRVAAIVGDQEAIARAVVSTLTPGTVVDPRLLREDRPTYLAAVVPGDGDCLGLAWTDLAVGEFKVGEFTLADAVAELQRLDPAEVVVPADGPPPEL